MESGCIESNAKEVLPFLDIAGVLESAVLYASDISDAPTAILSSGMVSCNNFSFNILTFQTPYMLASAKLMSSALERVWVENVRVSSLLDG